MSKRREWRWAMTAASLLLAGPSLSGITFPLSWEWSNPTPHGNNIIDIACQDGLWIQVAERGQIYTSTNLATWVRQNSHTTRALRAVTFFKGKIVAVGENAAIVVGAKPSELQALDLGSSDWLEGVAASPQAVVAVGDNGAIYTSPDGLNWQRRAVAFDSWLRSAAYGTPGGVGTFVAVGEAGFVATSTDGTQWQLRTPITAEDLNRVVWSNGEFWAVGNSGTAFQSSSGSVWAPTTTGATGSLNAFASLLSNRVVAGDAEVRVRMGRGPWTDELSPTKSFRPPVETYLSASTDTNSFFLCGRTGTMAEGVLYGTETVWFTLWESIRNWLWDVKKFPGVFLAAGDRATILSSLDGVDWQPELPPDSATNSIFLGVGGTTNLAVIVGNAGSIITSLDQPETVVTTNGIGTLVTNLVSTLGIYWQAVEPRPTTNDLQGITVLGSQFVATGGGGTVLVSPDARSWFKRSTPTSAFLSSVESYPGGVVAVGRQGTILTSPDAGAWQLRSSQTTNWIYRVRFRGGKLVAVGQNGTILTSNDGASWDAQSSGTTHWLNDVDWIGSTFFAVGNQGTVLSSPDAVTWTDRGTITGKSLFGLAQDAGTLISVGVEGVILRTDIVPADGPIRFLRYPTQAEGTIFSFAGQPGQRFALDRSTDLRGWIAGPLLQIDTSGTLQYQDAGTNSSQQQFFRARPQP